MPRNTPGLFGLLLVALLASAVPAAEPSPPTLRSIPLIPPQGDTAGFTPLGPDRTGVGFTNALTLSRVAQNRLIEDGSGIAAGDVDGDGLCDLYFCSLEGGNRLYRNLGGLRFQEMTAPGIACPGQASTGAAFADLDADGDLDLLVNGLGEGTRLFLNDGRGHFHEATEVGLGRDTGARSLALADVDGDGDLDLYVTNYRRVTARDGNQSVQITRRGGRLEVPPDRRDQFLAEATASGGVKLIELGEPDVLYRHSGTGTFNAVSWTSGDFQDEDGRPLTEPPRDWGLSAMFHDLNGDGLPDLYVCNDLHSPDRVWMNRGHGQFRAISSVALRKTSWASMAVDFADVNRDGLDDFFVADMLGVTHLRRQTQRDNFLEDAVPRLGWGWELGQITNVTRVMRNTLFLNLGHATYAEMACYAGVQASDWTWGVAFLDVDLDGYEDLLIANGHARDHLNSDVQARLAREPRPRTAKNREDLFRQIPELAVPKRAFRNRGDLTFDDHSGAWHFDWTGISNGMALADLDNDGDLDVILNNLNAGALIMRNDATAARIAVRLHGPSGTGAGIGARIQVRGGPVPQSQEVICGGRYLSCDDPLRVFAVGASHAVDLEVRWPSGRHSHFEKLPAGFLYHLAEPVGQDANHETGAADRAAGRVPDPLFEDRSDALKASHQRIPSDELQRQPLLPRRLGQNGPGVSWIDLNGDGRDDLVLAAGHGKPTQAWYAGPPGTFIQAHPDALSLPSRGDQTTLLGWAVSSNQTLMLAGVSGYELTAPPAASVAVYAAGSSGVKPVFGFQASPNVGPLAAATLDDSGRCSVFVGGQSDPGRYPSAVRSVIYRQEGDRFVEDTGNTRRLAQVGLINGAVWTDLDGDGNPDLALACEWGPVRVFRNDHGLLSEVTGEVGLADLLGGWNGIAAGDFNGDGRLDLVASNWGLNTRYQECLRDELRIYHGDLDDSGTWDVVEASWDRELGREVPLCDYLRMGRAVPSIAQRFLTHASYASASVQEIFGDALRHAASLRINTLATTLFVNEGRRFEARPLPLLAQLTPAFAVVVADFDGDGHEDLVLGQNSFAGDRESGRYDAGAGLWLRGVGNGDFVAEPAESSGLKIHGEQRGAAVADFDEDGRPDLVVTQHAGPLKLLRNRRGRPGLRVHLVGPPGNARGVGAQVRLKFREGYGAVREVHAGSGYWSQDSTTVVLSKPGEPSHLWVRWPGGRIVETPLPAAAGDVWIDPQGALRPGP